MKANELEPKIHTFLKGYWSALNDYAIWKGGEKKIVCLETPIKELMQLQLNKFGVDFDDFYKSVQ